MTTKTDPEPADTSKPKVCDNCGMANAGDVRQMSVLRETRFAPPWGSSAAQDYPEPSSSS